MKNFYFTFGSSHVQTDGTAMQDYWVRVVAKNRSIARHLFLDMFMEPNMEALDKFSHQYDDHGFNKDLFTKGEFTLIEQIEEVSNG